MIDVHVLTCEHTVPSLLARCLRSLEGQPVVVHVVDNAGYAVGYGRSVGYALGTAPFVSYIDCDDYALPGAYQGILSAMAEHRGIVARENIQWECGHILPRSFPGHAPVCYRREDVLPFVWAMAEADWCVDKLLRDALSPTQIPIVGQVRTTRLGSAKTNIRGHTFEQEKAQWQLTKMAQ